MFDWFGHKKRVEKVREETLVGFSRVKKDMESIGTWIKHLDSNHKLHKNEISEIKEILSTIKEDVENLKNSFPIVNGVQNGRLSQSTKRPFIKQSAVYTVQTAVQTAVQSPNFNLFSTNERLILWTLINTDLKLSYEDIASLLGKEKSTIKGQINTIKAKSEGIILESMEKNGKKRVFIPEEIKEKLLKKPKVRVKKRKND